MTGPDVGRMLRLSAQSDADEQVHAVELAAGELVDPSRLQTRCGGVRDLQRPSADHVRDLRRQPMISRALVSQSW